MYGRTASDKIECKMKRRGIVGITFPTDNAIHLHLHICERDADFSSTPRDLPALNI